jgi:hypothetical protein
MILYEKITSNVASKYNTARTWYQPIPTDNFQGVLIKIYPPRHQVSGPLWADFVLPIYASFPRLPT